MALATSSSAPKTSRVHQRPGLPQPAQLRVQFRYDGEGHISRVSVMPVSFEACVAPIVAGVTLPTSLAVRELATWIFSTAQ